MSINLIQFLTMKLHQGPAFIDIMVNSTEVHSSLEDEFREGRPKSVVGLETILMLCANWYCKIVMWPIVRLRQP